MMKICRKYLVLGMLLGGVMSGSAQGILEVNAVLAIVHDMVITRGDVLYFTEPLRESLESSFYDRPEVLAQKRMEALQEGLNTLIERKLIMHEFNTAGYNLPETVIDEEIKDRVRKRFGDRVRLVQTLKTRGRTYESYRREVREQFIEEALRAKHVSSEIIISPFKIEAYYATNQSQFQVEEQVKLRMIRLIRAGADDMDAVRKRALEIQTKVNGGTPFSEMAGTYSQGSPAGGEWGWVGNNTLSKGLTDVFFKLKAGERSGLLARGNENEKTYWLYLYNQEGRAIQARKYGPKDGKESLLEERALDDAALPAGMVEPQEFYLLCVEDVRGNHVRPLSEIREEIEKTLIVEERGKALKKWINKLRAKTFVQTF
jgi:peptidyl-prolyl cis-trans isomerase SurA